MTIKIRYCTEPDELYCHYKGQSQAQPAYIELDLPNATLMADYNAAIGNAVPFTVYHGLDRRYPIPILTAKAANRVMEETLPLANRIHADWEKEWDGNNHVAVLGEDAKAAEEEIETLLGLTPESDPSNGPNEVFDVSDLIVEWDPDVVINGSEVSDYDITADTTDERLKEIEQQIMSDLERPSGVAVCHGLFEHLQGLRDELADEQD